MSRRETAVRLFKEGYSCSQSVLLAFSDQIGISEEQAALVSSSFGAGIGKLREVCGAVSGMLMAAGLIRGYANPRDPGRESGALSICAGTGRRLQRKKWNDYLPRIAAREGFRRHIETRYPAGGQNGRIL